MSNRDEQFAGFAKALLQRIDEAIGKEADRAERGEATQTQQEFANMLGVIIAHAAYDLVEHSIYCNGISPDYWPDGRCYGQASDIYLREIARNVERIPDMSTLPEEK